MKDREEAGSCLGLGHWEDGAGTTETGNFKEGAHFGGQGVRVLDVCRLACLPDIQMNITVSPASPENSKMVGVT